MATETNPTTTPATKETPSVSAPQPSPSVVTEDTKEPSATPPLGIRLKAKLENDITEVKALITHPMETGLHLDQTTGKPIPPHFIEEVTCEHNGKPVISANWGIGISKDPYWAFKFKGGKVGDKVKLTWKDNQGKTDSIEVEIEN
jgi:sulfur-oxidizing protein SoxZ